jgi:hypothetical protein
VGAFYPERDMEASPRILERRVITVTEQDMPRLGIVDLGAVLGADVDLVSDAGMVPALVVAAGVGVGEKLKATDNSNVNQR